MNYLSRPYQIDQPIERGNINFDISILNNLQSRYDANKAAIDSTLAQYESLRGLTPEDNAYIASQVSNVKNQINSLGSLNLAHSTGRDTILNNMKNVLSDPIVQDILVSKANVESLNAEFKEVAKKDPTKATQENLQYSLDEGGYYDYVNGKTKKIGSMTYRPYSDYHKKMNDSLKEIESLSKDTVVQVPNPNVEGGMIQITRRNLTPAQVRQVAEASLDQHDRKQLEIDAWANSNRFQSVEVTGRAKSYAADEYEKARVTRVDLESKLKKGGTDKQKADWNASLADAIATQKEAEAVKDSPRLATIFLQKKEAINGTVLKWGNLYSEGIEYKVDEAYENNRAFSLKEKEFQLETSKFEYTQAKDVLDREAKEGGESDVTGKGRLQTITGKTITDKDLPSIEAQMDAKIAKGKEALTPISSGYKAKLEEISIGTTPAAKEAKNVLDAYKINLKSKKANESDLDVFNRTVLGRVKYGSSIAIIDSTPYLSNLRGAYDSYDRDVTARTVSISTREKEHVANTIDNDTTYSQYFSEKGTKMLWYANGKPTAAPVYKVLQSVGLMDANGKKVAGKNITDPEFKDVLNALKKSYYADDVLSKPAINPSGSLLKLASSLGETKDTAITEGVYINPETGQRIPTFKVNPNSKTGQFLANAKRQGIYDIRAAQDQSLSSDDRTTNRFLREEYKPSEAYKENLQKYVDKLPENVIVAIPTTNKKLHEDIGSYATSNRNSEGTFWQFDPKQGINIRNLDDNYVEISQNVISGGRQSEQKVNILKKDFYSNYPELAKKVDFEGKVSKYNIDNISGKRFVSAPIEYFNTTQTNQYNYANEVLFKDISDPNTKMKKAVFLNASDTSQYLNRKFAEYKQQAPEIATFISKAVKSSGDYSINMESIKGFNGDELQLKLVEASSGDVIDVMTYKDGKNVDIGKIKQEIDNTPQTLFGEFLDKILEKQQSAAGYGGFDESFERLVKSLN